MNKDYYAIIMAGGIGSRFHPLSTPENPKQFHDLLGTGRSLLQHTFDRLDGFIPTENIYIATNENYLNLVQQQLNIENSDRILLEPVMRNTAPCILYSALKLYQKNPDAVLVVAPSDHWIENETAFINNLELCAGYCAKNDALLTMGIRPTKAHTGYGYIKYNGNLTSISKVEQFTEKPNSKTALKFLECGDYLWNSGIFIWSAKSIIKAFSSLLPQMTALFKIGMARMMNSETGQSRVPNGPAAAAMLAGGFGVCMFGVLVALSEARSGLTRFSLFTRCLF